MTTIRYIELRVTPLATKRRGDSDLHEVQIEVRTTRDRTTRREIMPEATFKSHFHWLLERIEHEVMEHSAETPGVAKID